MKNLNYILQFSGYVFGYFLRGFNFKFNGRQKWS